VLALSQGGERLGELRDRIAAALEATVLHEDGLANWPPAMLLTGDELWLERARAFAMHAIGQVEGSRYSLWTGDIGIALYLWSCATATADVPTIDYW